MSTSFYNDYMYYNEVKVDLFCADESVPRYTISNINKKTLPGPDSGAHLQSISITPPVVGLDKRFGGVRMNYCAKGTVTIIDYKNSVFNRFAEHMKHVVSHSSGVYYTPSICITVKCYTGTEIYDGFVNDYKFSFSGGAPTITLEWTSIPVAKNQQPSGDSAPVSPFVQYYTIGGFINAIKEIAKDNPMPKINFKMNGTTKAINDGAELDKDLRFVNDNPDTSSNPSEAIATYDVRKLSAKTGNPVHDALIWLGNNVVTKGAIVSAETGKALTEEDKNKSIKTKTSRRPLSGTIQKDGSYLLQVIEDPVNPSNEKNEFTELTSSIVFVQNGKFAPYKLVSFNNLSGVNSVPDFKNTPLGDRIVIPMTSISFETSFSNLVLQYDILNGINYTTVTANGSDQISGAPTNGEASAQTTTAAEDANSSTTEISFTCYNVMSFSMNCPSAKIAFIVYDEYGEIHPMSGYGTVREVTYDISGAVVSANVKITKAFNSIDVSDNNNAAPASGDNQPQQS